MTDFDKFMLSSGISSMVSDSFKNSYQCPSIIEESSLHGTSIDVFSRLMADRIIFMGTEITPDSANIITSQLLYLDNVSNSDITIYINSPGGDVYSGLQIYDTMQIINSEVSTVCAGMAASMGSVLLCAGEKGKRLALPHSRVMIHQPMSSCPQGSQASDMEIRVKEINRIKKELYQILSDHSNMSFNDIAKKADRDYWMTADEALRYGMIDDIIKK